MVLKRHVDVWVEEQDTPPCFWNIDHPQRFKPRPQFGASCAAPTWCVDRGLFLNTLPGEWSHRVLDSVPSLRSVRSRRLGRGSGGGGGRRGELWRGEQQEKI